MAVVDKVCKQVSWVSITVPYIVTHNHRYTSSCKASTAANYVGMAICDNVECYNGTCHTCLYTLFTTDIPNLCDFYENHFYYLFVSFYVMNSMYTCSILHRLWSYVYSLPHNKMASNGELVHCKNYVLVLTQTWLSQLLDLYTIPRYS